MLISNQQTKWFSEQNSPSKKIKSPKTIWFVKHKADSRPVTVFFILANSLGIYFSVKIHWRTAVLI